MKLLEKYIHTTLQNFGILLYGSILDYPVIFEEKIMEETLFDRIHELAIKSGKSINSIERELGYPRNALMNYKVNSSPSATRLFQLSSYFEVPPEYLLGGITYSKSINIKNTFEILNLEQRKDMYLLCHEWFLSELQKNLFDDKNMNNR